MTDFTRIITSVPVNSQAARQMGRGETWTPAVTTDDYSADMPKLKPIKPEHWRSGTFRDFTGLKFGNLTVIGLKDKSASGDVPASWVCRCVCGGFCSRRSKTLKDAERNGNTFLDRCGLCQYQDKLRRGWSPNLKVKQA